MDKAVSTSAITNGGGEPAPPPAPIPAANAPPPFLVKTYDMVDDPGTDKIVSWSPTNNSFVVWDSAEFGKILLPKYFKHNNFSSFVRQLNTYGFRKVDPDRWEFANEGFLRGQKHLLKTITRRKPVHGHSHSHPPTQPNGQHPQNTSLGPCVEVGKFGLEEEVERLKRDKNVLMQELVRLRQQQQTTDSQLQATVQRLQGMEQRQQQMMSFLAKAVNSPGFLQQFMQNDNHHQITETTKKRRLVQDNDINNNNNEGQIVKYQPLMNEAANAMLRQIMKQDEFENVPEDFRVSGVTLQEVTPTCTPLFIPSEVQSPPSITIPETDGVILPESNKIPLELGPFSNDDLAMGFLDDDLIMDDMQELPGVGDPFWEKFLQSPGRVESDDFPEGGETGNMADLTEQMGLLSSDSKKV